MNDTLILALLAASPILLWLDVRSLRRKVRELQATSTEDAAMLRREQDMLLANTFRRGAGYLFGCMMGSMVLLTNAGVIAYRTGVGLGWCFVILLFVVCYLYCIAGAPTWLWRWLLQRPE